MAGRTDRPLTVVKDGAPPAKKVPAKKAPAKRAPRKFSAAAKLSPKTRLEALRDQIAKAMEDPRAHPRDVANLAKQFMDVCDKLDALGGRATSTRTPAEPSAVADTPNADWDEDAI